MSPLARIARAMRRNALASSLVVAVVAFVAAYVSLLAVRNLAPLTSADRFVRDLEIARLTPEQPPDADIVLVTIDEETLRQFPYRSPIDRGFLAKVLTTIASKQPRAIGLDVLLDQQTEAAKDAQLRTALHSLGVPLFAAYADIEGTVDSNQLAFLDGFVPPKSRALVNLAKDQGDTVRWIYPGAAGSDGRYVLSFPRALVESTGVKTSNEIVELVWRGKPADMQYPFAQYSAQTVAVLPAAWFKDKIVLIGSDVSLTDRHRTPFASLLRGGEGMFPGVVVQAYAVSQLLHHVTPPTLGMQMELAIAFLAALLSARLGAAGSPLWMRWGGALAAITALWIAAVLTFHWSGPMIGLVAPTIASVLAFSGVDSIVGGQARRQREFIQGAFSRYISPKLVDRLVRDPERMSLDGERRSMTFIFTDVKDFTAISEKLDSKDLPRILNAYLDGMTRIVLKHDGMVDKFIGDAVFAIFNAPVDVPNHPERAVNCALELDTFATKFKNEQNAAGIDFGLTRIGVHTGVATVGNFGSQMRFTYTAQGDAVNTAARLESLNKHLGTQICVSGTTRQACKSICFRPVASVVLKGKTDPVDIFQPLHDGEYAEDYLERYDKAFENLLKGSEAALGQFEALHAERPDDPCVWLHLKRLKAEESGILIVMDEK